MSKTAETVGSSDCVKHSGQGVYLNKMSSKETDIGSAVTGRLRGVASLGEVEVIV